MRDFTILLLSLTLLPLHMPAQIDSRDSASSGDRSFLEYNGLHYGCFTDTLKERPADTLLAYWEDSLDKIQHVRRYVQLMNWLQCALQSNFQTIVVNIPAADLFVFREGTPVFYSRVVVGKPSTPTHTVSGSIRNIVLYPYWMVPRSIATKELLPKIKKDPAFLENNNFQVLDNRGKIVDPAKVPWSSLSKTYFPYQLRQSTGCDNSLGILKFDFYNPFSAYLHDTPEKHLFSRESRFYSHGCIRVERAIELARLLLQDNGTAVDTLLYNPCRLYEQPRYVQLPSPVNVFIFYSRAWPNEAGDLRFFRNVYRKS